jgi:hypothetical protein
MDDVILRPITPPHADEFEDFLRKCAGDVFFRSDSVGKSKDVKSHIFDRKKSQPELAGWLI